MVKSGQLLSAQMRPLMPDFEFIWLSLQNFFFFYFNTVKDSL